MDVFEAEADEDPLAARVVVEFEEGEEAEAEEVGTGSAARVFEDPPTMICPGVSFEAVSDVVELVTSLEVDLEFGEEAEREGVGEVESVVELGSGELPFHFGFLGYLGLSTETVIPLLLTVSPFDKPLAGSSQVSDPVMLSDSPGGKRASSIPRSSTARAALSTRFEGARAKCPWAFGFGTA